MTIKRNIYFLQYVFYWRSTYLKLLIEHTQAGIDSAGKYKLDENKTMAMAWNG